MVISQEENKIKNVIFVKTKYIFCFKKLQLKTPKLHVYVVQYNFQNKTTSIHVRLFF